MNILKNLLLLNLLFFTSCETKNQRQTITLNEIGWTFKLPLDFVVKDSSSTAVMVNRAQNKFEQRNETKVEKIANGKYLILAINEKTNDAFHCEIIPCDSTKENWIKLVQFQNQLAYDSYQKEKYEHHLSNAFIDTASSELLIDNLLFNEFNLKVVVDGRTIFSIYSFSKLYKGNNLGIVFNCYSKEAYNNMNVMLKNSRFKK